MQHRTSGTALGSAGTFKWKQDSPENRDAVTRVEEGPPEYGFFESAAEFGLSITGELQRCCKFGPKSEFQMWIARLREGQKRNTATGSHLQSCGTADQLHAIRQQLLCAQAEMPADVGFEGAGALMKLQFGTAPAQPQLAVTAIHARSFDTWMASHQPPAQLHRVLAPPVQLCEGKPAEKLSGRGMAAADAAISRTVHKLARRAPPTSQAVAMVQQLAAQHAASNGSPGTAGAAAHTLSSGMTQALRDWVDGIPDASQCCSISRPAACWHCTEEDSAPDDDDDDSAGLRAAWAWLMAFVGCLDEHGAIDTVAVASVTISYAMEEHTADPAIAGLMMPLLRLQHTCAGNVSASSTIQSLLRVVCALQRLLATALPAAATTLTPAGQAQDETPTSSDASQLHGLLTSELPRMTHAAAASCVRCLRIATSEVLVMAVATVERAPEAAASNAVSQQLLQILSSEALMAAAAATLGDSGLPQRARSAMSVTLAVFREAAAATTVRKSVEVHMMHALQLHAPDVSAALSALHRSLADAGPLRMRGRSTLVRWVCDWACCPVLSLRPNVQAAGGVALHRKAKRHQRTQSRSGTPATPAVPPPDTHIGRAGGGWVHDAAVCVVPDVLASARGWFAVRLLQAIAADEQQEQPEVDAWLVLMGTPSIHLGKGATLKGADGAAAATSRPGTPCVGPPGTPATPAGAGILVEVAAPLLAAEVPVATAETTGGDHPLQGALLDWMASSSILGATALTGDHGNTVAAFAVMLVEAGLLCVGDVERQWLAEARSEAAERSVDVLAAGQKTPSTPAARHAWFCRALDSRLADAVLPSSPQRGASAGPSPPFSPAAAGPDSPAPPSSVSSPASGPSQSRTASAEPLSVPPPEPPAPIPAAPPVAPPLPYLEWLASCNQCNDACTVADVTASARGASVAIKRQRPFIQANPGPALQAQKVSFDTKTADGTGSNGVNLPSCTLKRDSVVAELDAQAARTTMKVKEWLWVSTGSLEAPLGADACLAACRRLPPVHQRLVTAWLMQNLTCFAPPHLKPVATCMQSVSITAWLASVKRNWWRLSADTLQGKGSPGRYAYSARSRLPPCPDADYLSTASPHAEWLPAVMSTLIALRGDAHAAMLVACVALRSMEHLASVPAAALLRLCCALQALLPMLSMLGIALPVADALRWAAARSAATAVRCSTLQRAAALLSVALPPPSSAQDPTVPTKPPAEKCLPANLPWVRAARSAATPGSLQVRPPAEYQVPDAEAVSAVVQALQLTVFAEEHMQAAGGDIEVAVSNAASGCGLEGTSAVFGVADVAVSAYVKVVEEGAVTSCKHLLTPLLAAVASAADAALAAEEAPGPRPALQLQLTSAILNACCAALSVAGSCTAGGAIAEFISAACGQGVCDIATATCHCLGVSHAEPPARMHAPFLAAMHANAGAPHMCVHCMATPATFATHRAASAPSLGHTLVPLLQRILPVDALCILTGEPRGLLHVAVREDGETAAVARAACNALLSAPALRLALMDAASHLPNSANLPPAAAYACMATLHFGHVVTVADTAAAEWQVALMRVLTLATPNRQPHLRPLLSAALDSVAPAAAANAGRGVPQQQLVQMIVAALLRYEGCAPVAITLALEGTAGQQKGTKSLHAAVLGALQRAFEAPPGADLPRQARVLAGGASLSRELLTDLPPALVASASGRPDPQIRMSALIDTCLVLLSRTDVQEWRAHARRLVQQISHIADALHCVCSGTEPAPATAEVVRQIMTELLQSSDSRSLLQSLWLRLELLMPVMPIVYHDATQPAAANLRHCLACALVKLIAHGSGLTAGAHITGTAEGTSVARVERRMVVLLQAIFSEQWSRWIVCHESRGSPKVTGRMLEQDAVVAVLRGVPMSPAARARLEGALPARIPEAHIHLPAKNSVVVPDVAAAGSSRLPVLSAPRFAGLVHVS